MNEESRSQPPSGGQEDKGIQTDPQDTTNLTAEEMPRSMGGVEKFITVFTEPSSLFKLMKVKSEFLVPFVVSSIVMILIGLALLPHRFQLTDLALELVGQTAGAGGSAARIGQAVARISSILGVVLAPVGLLFGWLIGAFVVWLLGLITGKVLSFGKLYHVIAYASLPTLFTQIGDAAYRLTSAIPTIDSIDALKIYQQPFNLSLGRILDPSSPFHTVANTYDIFQIWTLWLLFLGLVHTLTLSRARAGTIVLIFIVLSALIIFGLSRLPMGGMGVK